MIRVHDVVDLERFRDTGAQHRRVVERAHEQRVVGRWAAWGAVEGLPSISGASSSARSPAFSSVPVTSSGSPRACRRASSSGSRAPPSCLQPLPQPRSVPARRLVDGVRLLPEPFSDLRRLETFEVEKMPDLPVTGQRRDRASSVRPITTSAVSSGATPSRSSSSFSRHGLVPAAADPADRGVDDDAERKPAVAVAQP